MNKTMLATINFVGTMLVNNSQRVYYRQKYLELKPLHAWGHCEDCKVELAPGALVAVGIHWYERFCLGCVAEMDEKEAYVFSEVRECDPARAAQLRRQKFGLTSEKVFNHAVSVAESAAR